jgi:hypothetical protein
VASPTAQLAQVDRNWTYNSYQDSPTYTAQDQRWHILGTYRFHPTVLRELLPATFPIRLARAYGTYEKW